MGPKKNPKTKTVARIPPAKKRRVKYPIDSDEDDQESSCDTSRESSRDRSESPNKDRSTGRSSRNRNGSKSSSRGRSRSDSTPKSSRNSSPDSKSKGDANLMVTMANDIKEIKDYIGKLAHGNELFNCEVDNMAISSHRLISLPVDSDMIEGRLQGANGLINEETRSELAYSDDENSRELQSGRGKAPVSQKNKLIKSDQEICNDLVKKEEQSGVKTEEEGTKRNILKKVEPAPKSGS